MIFAWLMMICIWSLTELLNLSWETLKEMKIILTSVVLLSGLLVEHNFTFKTYVTSG